MFVDWKQTSHIQADKYCNGEVSPTLGCQFRILCSDGFQAISWRLCPRSPSCLSVFRLRRKIKGDLEAAAEALIPKDGARVPWSVFCRVGRSEEAVDGL